MTDTAHTYNSRQGYSVLMMFLVGSTVILSPGRDAKGDIWLALLVAFALALPLAVLYGRLIQIYPGSTLYDMQLDYFGAFFGRVTIALFTWYSMHIGAFIMREFTEFIQINTFNYLPQYLFAVPLGILSIWCIRAGIGTLGRWCIIVMPFFLLLLVVNSLFSIPQWRITNIQPVMYEGFMPVWSGAIRLLALPFLEVPLALLVCQPFQKNRKAIHLFVYSFAASTLVLIIIFVRNIFILGVPLNSKLLFPSYQVVKLSAIGNFIQGLEVLASVIFMTGYFVKLTVFLYAAVVGFAKILGMPDYRKLAAPVGLMFVTFSLFISHNFAELANWEPAMLIYYSLPTGAFLPLVLWIIGEWKWHRKKKEKNGLANRQENAAGSEGETQADTGGTVPTVRTEDTQPE